MTQGFNTDEVKTGLAIGVSEEEIAAILRSRSSCMHDA